MRGKSTKLSNLEVRMKRNKKLEAIQLLYDLHNTEDEHGTYDRGLINGIAICISILTGQPPKYVYNKKFELTSDLNIAIGKIGTSAAKPPITDGATC